MNTTTPPPYKKAYVIGLAFNLISFIVYLLSAQFANTNRGDIFSGVFFLNFGLTAAYAILLLAYKLSYNRPRPKLFYGCWISLIILFTISAFSLNKEMNVFAPLPTWLNIYILIMVALFFAFPYVNRFPNYVKAIIYTFSGSVLLLSIYMTLYLVPLFPLSLLVFWFFGISLHSFVPLIWLTVIIIFLAKKTETSKLKHFAWLGAFIPLLILGIYLSKWNEIQTQIKDIISEKNLQLGNHLPDAIQLAQKLPSDPITEKIMISPFKSQRFWGSDVDINGTGELKFHDPLSLIAIEVLGELNIDETTVETFLNIRRDYRHKTTRKLWTGVSLSTSSIASNIQVFPEYRIAYHEKTFVIHNDPHKTRRDFWFTSNTQEANYTFHVPEGSIVTSLSLWINGKEQKSRLSTLQKADSAYTTIVGVQQRDPAIVHWQEGNRITANVFPCTENEDRTFKIGFTTPLSVREGRLWLENIWFEGPDFNSAREATKILFSGKQAIPVDLPDHFKKDAKGGYTYTGDYEPSWELGLEMVKLSENKFRFNGYEYSLKEQENTTHSLKVSAVFLDITKEWTKEEYDKIVTESGNQKLYTWLPEKVEITTENKELVWETVCHNQFSMPFLYDITYPEGTVVITKSGSTSPILADMKGSDYAEKTTAYLLNSSQKINVINIGTELSPLWRSLLELRLINYSTSSIKNVGGILQSGKINTVREDSSIVSLNESHLSIMKKNASDSLSPAEGPDHLLRLFAYNDLMRKIGKHYFEKEKYETTLFKEAEEGYVVTPLTSMIVLESEADYKQMGIDENVNTVGNAGIIGGGAVPEPHEWLLIGLVLVLIVRHLYSKKKLSGSYFRK